MSGRLGWKDSVFISAGRLNLKSDSLCLSSYEKKSPFYMTTQIQHPQSPKSRHPVPAPSTGLRILSATEDEDDEVVVPSGLLVSLVVGAKMAIFLSLLFA